MDAKAPPPPPSRPGLRFARKPKVEQDHPRRIDAERGAAEVLAEWLTRTGTSRDSFGEASGRSGTYVAKMLATEVALPVDAILALDDRNALSLIRELEQFVTDRSRGRRLAG
jgi:hypothetical protein